MSLTRAAIDKNRITGVVLIVILFAGIGAYNTMPRDEDPGFIIRTAMVRTMFPGASPERIEMLITDKLEKVIQEMPELDFINSTSKTGVSLIYVNIQERYTQMRPIWDRLRRKVDSAKGQLPDGIIGPIVDDEFGDVFGTIVTVTGEGYTYAELKTVADQVRDELLLIDEVAKVDIYGAQEERIFVEYNNARLAELGMSPYQLQQILQSRNIIFPGGDVTTGRERMVLEPSGNFESVEELRRTVITLPGRREVVYLEDIAAVYRGYIDPPASKMYSSGVPCLGLGINLREGGNIILLGEKVKTTIARLQAQYPIGVDFEFVAFQPQHVQKKIDDFIGNLGQAVLIVVVVMLITLGLRTGLVVASLVPMAIVMSLLVMSFFGIGIDQMSLASLIIALGMLVDNAIVMSESIMVQMERGKKAVDAAEDSASELRIPLLTSSLTTAAAFLPIYLAESNTGEYTAPLFKVVTITLLCSWILAMTMIPLLSVLFLKVKQKSEKKSFESPFYWKYRGFLLGLLRHRTLSVGGIVLIFIIALQGFAFIPNIFFPANDKAIFTAKFELPIGTPIDRTERIVSEIERFMTDELKTGPDRPDGIVNWSTYVGQSAPRFMLSSNPEPGKPEFGMMLINATERDLVPSLTAQIEAFCFDRYPDLSTDIQPLALGPPATAPVEVRLSGKSLDRIFDIADQTKAQLATIPGVKNIRENWGARTKKLMVNIDQPRARRAGLSSQDVAVSLQTVLSGIETTQYREDDKVIPVTLRSVAADRQDIGKLESHNIFSPVSGRSVPLKQVADIEVAWQPSKVLRRDRLKTVTVKADVTEETTPIAVSRDIGDWLDRQTPEWGIGYKYELGGEIENSVKANQSIADKMPIGMFVILMLLVGQFNSLRRTAIILLIIPLGLIGVIIGLLIGQSYFGFMTLLGIIALAGIVINNAIVLLDRIRIEIDENGLDPARAVVESAQQRLRPILLTTATTIGGLIPLWLGGGPMWEPMAISIIFGLAVATMLTLGVVPVLYSIFFRVKFKGFEY